MECEVLYHGAMISIGCCADYKAIHHEPNVQCTDDMPPLLRDVVMNGRGILVAYASVKEKQGAFAWILTDMEEQERYTIQKTVRQVKEPITSYRAEGFGILDSLRFIRQQGIPKKTPVSIFCDNLSGVQ